MRIRRIQKEKGNQHFKYAFFTTLVWKIAVIIVGILGSHHTVTRYGNPDSEKIFYDDYLFIWSVWDGGYYKQISEMGYQLTEIKLAAFFPLYPLLQKIFSYLFFGNLILGGLAVNFIAVVVCGYYFLKLAQLHLEKKHAQHAWLYLLFFPAAAFFNFIYTEALFLAFCIPCFYYARKHQFLKSALLGMGAAMTRNLGVFLVIPVFIEIIKASRSGPLKFSQLLKNCLYLGFIPLGLGLFMIHLNAVYGDYFAFSHVQAEWGREIDFNLWTTFTRSISGMLEDKSFWWGIEIFHALFFIFLSLYTLFRVRLSYGIFMLICVIVPLLTGVTSSINRYVIAAFPAFIILALWTKQRPYLHQFLLNLFLMLQTLYIILFVNNYWTG